MAALSARASATSWLTRLSGERVVAGRPEPVTAVCADSRRVVPGALFVAIPGFETDGHDHIEEALRRGATALLVEEERRAAWEPFASKADIVIVAVPDTRRASAQAAAGFFGDPGRALGTIGVTGTDGKTTTVHLIAHVLESAGRTAGYLSSVAFRSDGDPVLNDSHMTTLEAPDVQQYLAAMVDAGRDYAVIEASSHGLALQRVDECHFDVAVFTTLSRDHLDFHGSMDEYRKAKGRLFEMLGDESPPSVPRAAVLNADDAASDYFRSLTDAPAIIYAIDADADVSAENIETSGLAVRFRLVTPSGAQQISAQLAGRYNVYNCLAAAAVAHSQGIELDQIAAGIESFSGVPGRLERIDAGQPFRVVVDIASTPEALRRVLSVLRPVTEGKLIAVFGCAGERDEARRDGMGRAAGELADFSVLTNEDPRREDPDAIIEAIAAGLREAGRSEERDFVRLPERREALRYAFERAGDGDTVLLAGKGTEQSIVVGTEHLPWDEARVARELLKELA